MEAVCGARSQTSLRRGIFIQILIIIVFFVSKHKVGLVSLVPPLASSVLWEFHVFYIYILITMVEDTANRAFSGLVWCFRLQEFLEVVIFFFLLFSQAQLFDSLLCCP